MRKIVRIFLAGMWLLPIQLLAVTFVQAECDSGGNVSGNRGFSAWSGDALEALLVGDSSMTEEIGQDARRAFVRYQYQVRQDIIHHGKRTQESDKYYLRWRELYEAREKAEQLDRVNFALDQLVFGSSNSRYFFGSYITSVIANWVACEHLENGTVQRSFTLDTLEINIGDEVRVLHAILMPPMR